MLSSEHADNKWLTSVELFETTGISRATLNNYIKMGIIPKPIVKRPDDPGSRAKKIGYFPPGVLDSISTVKRMKKEGISMESIVGILTGKNSSSQSGELRNDEPTGKESILTNQHQDYVDSINNIKVSHEGSEKKIQEELLLNLSISDIKCPAFLINNNFEIVWINTEAEKNIFGIDFKLIKDTAERNIFRLLSKMGLILDDGDINDLVSYLVKFVKNKIPKNSIFQLYNGISENEILFLQKIYDRSESISKELKYATYLKLAGINGKDLSPHHAYHVVFREGILILLEPVNDIFFSNVDSISSRPKIIHELMKRPMPSLVSFCALVADLQDSSRICAELPPEECLELIRDMWKCMDEIFKKYYGIYGKHIGVGMIYYFVKENNSNYILNSINCALELKEKIKQINMEWKTRKGWLNNLYLNIGINEGQEYFVSIPSPNIEFTTLGDTVNYAGRLSDMARSGTIWTTKNLMNRLDIEQRKTLRFGIRRIDQGMEIFRENLFARVMDMLPLGDPNYSKFMDIATVSVTEIINTSSYC